MTSPHAAGRPAPPHLPDMIESYDAYFSSGLYHSRYPVPNRRTLRYVLRHLPAGGRVIDFGAGEGRYSLALAKDRDASVLAVDISPVARAMLTENAARLGVADRIAVVDDDDAAYREGALGSGGFDVALLGFGVLGHVAGRASRLAILRELGSSLSANGRLIMGLPNAARRFRAAQAEAAPRIASGEFEPGDICYRRRAGAQEIELFYHLFHRAEIGEDLRQSGLVLETLTLESLLPERAVTASPLLGRLDDAACSLLPAAWGYGYLVVARRA